MLLFCFIFILVDFEPKKLWSYINLAEPKSMSEQIPKQIWDIQFSAGQPGFVECRAVSLVPIDSVVIKVSDSTESFDTLTSYLNEISSTGGSMGLRKVIKKLKVKFEV